MREHISSRLPRFLAIAAALASLPLTGRGDESAKPGWLGPTALITSHDGKQLFVSLADAQEVAVVDPLQGQIVKRTPVPGKPTALLLDEASSRLFVACDGSPGAVCVLDCRTLAIRQSFPAGHGPAGLAVAPDGSKLFVCNRFDNDVSVISLASGRELARVKAVREPVDAAITPDGKTVFVVNLLPDECADGDAPAAQVTVIDVASLATANIRLPGGSSSARAICVSPDGQRVFVTHVLSRNLMPTTQLERGWMNTSAVSILEAGETKVAATILLDDPNLGAGGPGTPLSCRNGTTLCVTHSGAHELSLIDLKGVTDKLVAQTAALRNTKELLAPPPPAPTGNVARSWDNSVLSMPLDPINDLSFLAGLRQRVALPGNGPRGAAIVGDTIFVAMYFSDTIAIVDLKAPSSVTQVKQIPLGSPPQMTEARRGEMIFHDATRSLQHWQSCATCHPDARADALNWDLMNDGFGNPKNTKSMLLAHRTPPAMSQSARENAETAVRAGFRSILFTQCPESDAAAVDAYLKSLQPVPSPHLEIGGLSAAAERGKQLFMSKQVGCAKCHPAPLFTDLKQHPSAEFGASDSGGSFDTPTLIEAWRTAPYLHDGRSKTVADILGKARHGSANGEIDRLSEQEIADLVEYVLSL
jgi:YVTN family beta-propeller protein